MTSGTTEDDAAPAERQRRERAFHDRWAAAVVPAEVPVEAAFESFTAPEAALCLRLMEPLAGRDLLELGSGMGEASTYLAGRGARVTAIDLSPGMAGLTRAVARSRGRKVRVVAASASALPFAPSSFDCVYGANVIHHVPDAAAVLGAVREALRPGGLALFWDPLAYNPLIGVYRRLARGVRSDDEAPLRFGVLGLMRRQFGDVGHREFWLLALLIFVKYFVADRKHPGEHRYWKEIHGERLDGAGRWLRPLQRLDALLLRLPPLNRLAWNIVYWGRRPPDHPTPGATAK